jgi:hypothetical protein
VLKTISTPAGDSEMRLKRGCGAQLLLNVTTSAEPMSISDSSKYSARYIFTSLMIFARVLIKAHYIVQIALIQSLIKEEIFSQFERYFNY